MFSQNLIFSQPLELRRPGQTKIVSNWPKRDVDLVLALYFNRHSNNFIAIKINCLLADGDKGLCLFTLAHGLPSPCSRVANKLCICASAFRAISKSRL